MTEKEFQAALCERFQAAGHDAYREVWCTVYDDSGSADGGLRRADLYVRFREPIDGWLASLAIECKGPRAGTGDLRTGVHQTIAYTRAFDWRLGRTRNAADRRPLPRPDLVAFTTPEIFGRQRCHQGTGWFERELWDNGGGLLEDSAWCGVRIKYVERNLVLIPRARTEAAPETEPEPEPPWAAQAEAEWADENGTTRTSTIDMLWGRR